MAPVCARAPAMQAMQGGARPAPFAAACGLRAARPRAALRTQRRGPAVRCAFGERTEAIKVVGDESGPGLRSVFSPYTLLPVALGGGGAYALGYSSIEGLALGSVIGAAARAAQLLLLESTVPFTRRRHTLLLPVGIELQMGNAIFRKQVHARTCCLVHLARL